MREKFLEQFKAQGVDSSRIDLLTLLPLSRDHLQSYQMMDLSLDTFPYAGTTTTCEALWMGVPVITLTGASHAHNVGASLLSAVGFTEWIATTKQEYINKAVQLATDIDALKQARKVLRPKMKDSPLCNAQEFTKNTEQVYTDCWKKFVKANTK